MTHRSSDAIIDRPSASLKWLHTGEFLFFVFVEAKDWKFS